MDEDKANEELVKKLHEAARTLHECLTRRHPDPKPQPEPQPVPDVDVYPVPYPDARLVYSAKFVCGFDVNRVPYFTPYTDEYPGIPEAFDEKFELLDELGDDFALAGGVDNLSAPLEELGEYPVDSDELTIHPDYLHRATYATEINVHNYTNNPITFSIKAVKANPLGAPKGRVSERVIETLGPNQAVQINCGNILRLLHEPVPPEPHEVCPGKEEAIKILSDILASDLIATSDTYFPARIIEGLIEALEKAIRLEEAGHLQRALVLEKTVAAILGRLSDFAEEQGRERLAERLTEAQKLVKRCIDVLVDDLRTNRPDVDADEALRRLNGKLLDGFVEIKTSRELEVTAVYRTNNHPYGGGNDIDVEQIRPHRLFNTDPSTTEPSSFTQ